MPLVLLNRRRRSGGFNPATLFALSEPGVWYDPSDLTTMFTDTAGTTPATVGQAVALVLDKSQQQTFEARRNLLTRTEEFNDAYWTVGAQNLTAISSGRITPNTTLGQHRYDRATTIVAAAHTFSLEVKADGYNFVWLRLGGIGAVFNVTTGSTTAVNAGVTATFTSAADGYTRVIISAITAGNDTVRINAVATSDASDFAGDGTSGILIRRAQLEVGSTATTYQAVTTLPTSWAGFHATQSTTTARPILARIPEGGRRNLLTRTEEFNDAAWTKQGASVSQDVTVAPDGTTSAEKIIENTATSNHSVIQNFTIAATGQHVFSFYAKAAERTWCVIRGVIQQTYFDLHNGVVGSVQSGTTASIQDVGNGWYRCIATRLISAGAINFQVGTAQSNGVDSYTGDGTSGIFIWGAQLELGSTATDYQKVVSTYDVTEAGKADLYHLVFDGIDDSMSTPSINFTGTDKMSVFAGVRLNSGNIEGWIINLNNNLDGSFRLRRNALNWRFAARGTTEQDTSFTTENAPQSVLLSGHSDFSQPSLFLRLNGAEVDQNLSTMGSGNFSNQALDVGKRSNNTAFFNGQIYSLIVRGAQTDLPTIQRTERYVGGKTGVVLP